VKAILETGREQFNFFENIESFDLIEHIESFKNQFLILAKKDKKDINFDFQIKKVNLSTKKNLIKNILTHLVKNAIDFSTKDETIEFVVKIVNRKVVISISNSGELPKNLKVFEPFTRGVTTKGLGLGLFLASSEAKLINASLNIEAKDGIVTSTLTL
jgi:signal transduction histidine kinase